MENENKLTSDNKEKKTGNSRKYLITGLIGFFVIGGIIGVIYWLNSLKTVYIDNSEIIAPHVDLSATAPGTLKEVMVKEGDFISSNTPVARVGDQLIKSDQVGLVVNVNDDIGKNFNPGEAVVTMIYPSQLRVVGHLAEDKGLSDVKVGQRALFTVDAFGSKQYIGTVDEVSEISNESSVAFSISDKRPEKQFDIKVRFNISQYPELKDGMSAKIWVYKK
jgi:multidrug resistance efflux pump